MRAVLVGKTSRDTIGFDEGFRSLHGKRLECNGVANVEEGTGSQRSDDYIIQRSHTSRHYNNQILLCECSQASEKFQIEYRWLAKSFSFINAKDSDLILCL